MPEPIIDNAVDGNWYDDMAGDDAGRIEVLSKFDSPESFYSNHQALANANWRTPMAGEDEAFGKQLERFDSPASFASAYREAQKTISEGIKPARLPNGATDEDIAAFRTEHGIPLEAAGYYENMPEGLVLGEDDKPMADTFMDALHSVNAPPEVAHALIGAYTKFAESEQDAQSEVDSFQSKEATDELRTTWGADYRTNINAVDTFLTNTFGEEAKEQMMNGRFQDGRAFMNNTKVLEAIASVQRKLDPLVPLNFNGEGDPVESMNDEIKTIEKFMRTNRSEYNKDNDMQARLRTLYDLRTKNQAA